MKDFSCFSKHGLVASGKNNLYLAGGEYPDGKVSNGFWRYDPVLDIWQEMAPMLTPRSEFGNKSSPIYFNSLRRKTCNCILSRIGRTRRLHLCRRWLGRFISFRLDGTLRPQLQQLVDGTKIKNGCDQCRGGGIRSNVIRRWYVKFDNLRKTSTWMLIYKFYSRRRCLRRRRWY